MKKLRSLAIVFILLAISTLSCAAKFDADKAVDKLVEEGLTLSTVYTTDRELADGSALANSEIAMMGGDFTVELTNYTSLIQKGDPSKNCQIFTFATEEQASAYAELYAASRWEGSVWKVAQSGCVVIVTNLDEVPKVIELEFR